ncbi:DUF6571 family protein [Streptomyces sp. NRRL F-5053]|uniref:DUF6571 family protein n=1 Tax=Streptomyces sp. NRRL F-5053 TaxID=1463854 RepID=UPI0013316715|nr:DUF6571 family protein [Streptomyces sp. NRRL F-5053]
MGSKRKKSCFAAGVIALVGVVVLAFFQWQRGDQQEARERDFCWDVVAKVSTARRGSEGTLGECAAALEREMSREGRARKQVVAAYGPHVAKNPEFMPGAVRRGVAEVLARYPGEVFGSLAWGGARQPEEEPLFSRDCLVAVARSVIRDSEAWRALREAQEAYIKKQIDGLDHSDLGRTPAEGRSDRAMVVADQTGRVTGTLSKIQARALGEGDNQREQRIKEYERHGYPWLREVFQHRAQEVGVPTSAIVDNASRISELVHAAHTAFLRAGAVP